MTVQLCSVDGCDRTVRARGWCIGHYNRWHLTGEPGSPDLSRRTGPDHHHWSGSQITYYGAHHRVAARRGSAKEHVCECGSKADTWAYRHDDPDQLIDDRGRAYSANPAHYDPMCFSCHTISDHARKRNVA